MGLRILDKAPDYLEENLRRAKAVMRSYDPDKDNKFMNVFYHEFDNDNYHEPESDHRLNQIRLVLLREYRDFYELETGKKLYKEYMKRLRKLHGDMFVDAVIRAKEDDMDAFPQIWIPPKPRLTQQTQWYVDEHNGRPPIFENGNVKANLENADKFIEEHLSGEDFSKYYDPDDEEVVIIKNKRKQIDRVTDMIRTMYKNGNYDSLSIKEKKFRLMIDALPGKRLSDILVTLQTKISRVVSQAKIELGLSKIKVEKGRKYNSRKAAKKLEIIEIRRLLQTEICDQEYANAIREKAQLLIESMNESKLIYMDDFFVHGNLDGHFKFQEEINWSEKITGHDGFTRTRDEEGLVLLYNMYKKQGWKESAARKEVFGEKDDRSKSTKMIHKVKKKKKKKDKSPYGEEVESFSREPAFIEYENETQTYSAGGIIKGIPDDPYTQYIAQTRAGWRETYTDEGDDGPGIGIPEVEAQVQKMIDQILGN